MTDTDKKRKYLLFSKDDGRPDALKPCAFFASPAGCKNGSKCKFAHGSANEIAPGVARKNNERPVIAAPVVVPPSPVVEVKKEKKQRKSEPERVVAAPVDDSAEREKEAELRALKAQLAKQQQLFEESLKPKPAPKPVVSEKDAEINLLKAQLAKQQQMFEEQMRQQQQQAPQVEKKTPKKEASKPQVYAPPGLSSKTPTKPIPALVPAVSHHQNKAPYTATKVGTLNPNISDYSEDDSEDENTEFLFDAVNAVLKDGRNSNRNSFEAPGVPPVSVPVAQVQVQQGAPKPITVTTPAAKKTPVKVAAPAPVPVVPLSTADTSLFVSSASAVKSLQTSGTKHATHGNTKKAVFANPKAPSTTTAVGASTAPRVAPPASSVFDAESVDFSSLPWMTLVHSTQAHPRYNKEYGFVTDPSWIKARPAGAWCAGKNVPAVIAIDCEMCETSDPVTGAKENNTLVRMSIVNGLNPSEVFIDTLVAPTNPVTELRSHIHGISEEQLQATNFSLRQAQGYLFQNISEDTIIIGHSVHNDLKALRFSHSNVIDTSYLFALENEPNAAASVRDISEQVLGVKLPDTHDSIQDARSALYSAAVILISGPQKPLVRTSGNPSSSALNQAAKFQLLVHRIPEYCTDEHITEMIIKYTQIVPVKVNPITRSGVPDAPGTASGKTTVQFFSQMHADLAFESIAGPNRPDKQGRDQKRIYLKGGGYICVRK